MKFSKLITLLLVYNNSHAMYNDLNYYVSIYGGLSWPLKNHFTIQSLDEASNLSQDIKVDIEKSYMLSASLGHKISEGSALEFSFDWKPRYPMKINLPTNLGVLDTNALVYVGMINFVYDLAHSANVIPYFVVGTGVANIKINDKCLQNDGSTVFCLTENNKFALAFQFGLGFRYKISNQVSFDIATMLQGISKIKIKYQTFNISTNNLDNNTTEQHLAVAKLKLGFVFDF
jgi:opacity protein-like surface antigen